jgi:hypothetical protein
MSDNQRDTIRQRRRALIKAAGAAPVVFSLASGSAVAAASLTCADKTRGQRGVPPVTSATDGWVRVKVTQLKFKLGLATWYGFQYGSQYYSVVGAGAVPFALLPGTVVTQQASSYYLAVNYVSPGVYGVDPVGPFHGNPIAGASCWNSVNPNGPGAGPGNLVP